MLDWKLSTDAQNELTAALQATDDTAKRVALAKFFKKYGTVFRTSVDIGANLVSSTDRKIQSHVRPLSI